MPLTLALAKPPFILLKAWLMYSSVTPPTAAPAAEEKQAPKGFERVFSRLIGWPPFIAKLGFAVDALAESASILAATFPSWLSSRVLDTLTGSPLTSVTTFAPSLTWAVGTFLAIFGGAFRLWAFRALGRHFTFELSLLKDHTLITTGPYAIVRHPSYTGLIMLTAGMTIAVGSPGTWTREVLFADIFHPISGSSTSGWATWARWFAAVNFAGQLAMTAGLIARTKTEDSMLKKEFGKQWDEWAKKTPWRLLPGIF